MKYLILTALTYVLLGCNSKDNTQPVPAIDNNRANHSANTASTSALLDSILRAQPEQHKTRFNARHPKETLTFFGIQPGMTVAEVLPGGGWYSQILLPLLGDQGKLVGVDYDISMWQYFDFASDAFIERRKTWSDTWTKDASAWRLESATAIEAYTFATLPQTLNASVDVALFFRALHNLNRFQQQGKYMEHALQETYRILKPGGLVGVVQHIADESKDDAWADGARGYLKKSTVVALFEQAGFSLVKASDININPKDQPNDDDIVWRLPPSYATSQGNEALKAEYTAIGESTRMTLLFRK